jgi:hypothetical protein
MYREFKSNASNLSLLPNGQSYSAAALACIIHVQNEAEYAYLAVLEGVELKAAQIGSLEHFANHLNEKRRASLALDAQYPGILELAFNSIQNKRANSQFKDAIDGFSLKIDKAKRDQMVANLSECLDRKRFLNEFLLEIPAREDFPEVDARELARYPVWNQTESGRLSIVWLYADDEQPDPVIYANAGQLPFSRVTGAAPGNGTRTAAMSIGDFPSAPVVITKRNVILQRHEQARRFINNTEESLEQLYFELEN